MPEHIGPYRIEGLLGRGGMGEVYRAYDEKLRRHVAIKLIRARAVMGDALKRFLREARTAAKLSHPSIVQIYHVEQVAGDDCIVMELVEGLSLARLTREGPLGPVQCASLACQIAAGLAEAHSKNIVHRDLKTENVMVTPEGQAKILDFGLARPLRRASSDTRSGEFTLAGTPRAMSPEQANELRPDHRSDLFSFGTLLYEVATGQSPFRGQTPIAILHQVCSHQPPAARQLNPDVPVELSELIDRLLQKQPEDRPQSAREVLARLEGILGAMSGSEDLPFVRPPALHDERRQITVLGCVLETGAGRPRRDVTRPGRTRGGNGLSVVAPGFLNAASEIIQRHLGSIADVTDTGLVACFGYPRAQEDDARRAVQAALRLAAKFRSGLKARDPALTLRVGLHTGVMEVPKHGERGATFRRPELLPRTGDPWDLLALLQRSVEPDTVWLSRTTHRLVRSSFRCDGPHVLPQVKQSVFRVDGLIDRRGAGPRGDLGSLVARRAELELLAGRWQLAREGNGQVVLVAGDAGIGKSRLLAALREHLELDQASWWACRATPELQTSALRPAVALLWQILATERWATPEESWARLAELLGRYGFGDRAPQLAALLGLPLAAADRPEARRREQQTIEAVLELLLALTEEAPRVWVIEDLHWADPATLELLDRLIEQVPASRLLLLLSFRPQFKPPWGMRTYLTQLMLSALSTGQTRALIDQLPGGKALPEELCRQIVELTDGVPLFVGEVTHLALESDVVHEGAGRDELSQPAWQLTIPTTLRDALMATLDRLGPGKQVAQLAAVCGREFSYGLLRAVSPFDGATLSRELRRLVEAEILYRRGVSSVRYGFQHALIRQVAYESLAEGRRRKYEARIASERERRAETTRSGGDDTPGI